MNTNENVTTLERRAFSLAEFAGQLGVSIGFLRLEISRQKLKVTRLGSRVLITRAEVERYLATT